MPKKILIVPNSREIQNWIISRIAALLDIPANSININEPLSNYGLSSLEAVTLSGDLEEWLGCRLPTTLVYDYPDILSLSAFLAGEKEKEQPAAFTNLQEDTSGEPIAVIGMSCRFPGAEDYHAFWRLLINGTDAIREVPADRWQKELFFHPDPTIPGKSVSYWGGFLDNIDQFDPFFFGISPNEAKKMDPQQRLLLELSYEALDDAGQSGVNLDGSKTGVFVGVSVNEYSSIQFSDPTLITGHSATGSALSIAANRISYFYNFHGPSMAIDTACSSSLSAVHLACQSLKNGECHMALAGGVNMIFSPAHSIAFTKAGVLAPDGRCKTFDARADGYVRGEGGGLVVLKPLSAALADGDPIHALILGSAMCQDGRTNGLIAPSSEAQKLTLREAYQAAGISPSSVQYVEAHGTGTLLGDSIETQALGAVVGADRKQGECAIGSVKTNIGHLEAAAGIAGLIKVILSLKHRIIPPSIHYHSPNPHIPFEALHLKVQDTLDTWPGGATPALAGVSSFGFGGTNVHMVVQEANPREMLKTDNSQTTSTESGYYVLPLSANSPKSLHIVAGTFSELLNRQEATPTIQDICHAAGVRRSQFHNRLAVTGNSRAELHAGLRAFLQEEQDPNLFSGDEMPERQPQVAFVFSGQGGQWLRMGIILMQEEPVFNDMIQRIGRIIQDDYGWSLTNIFEKHGSLSWEEEIDMVQPAIFAIQVALSELLKSWGIVPDAVVGHSMGEVAAAHVAGILNLKDCIRIICKRSQLLRNLKGKGSMLATELSPEQASELIQDFRGKIAVAVINSPRSTVLSGEPEAIKKVMEILQFQNLFCRLVNVDVASHSPQMDQLSPEMLNALEGIHPLAAKIPMYSTVTGKREDGFSYDASYWVDNLRKPVLFSSAAEQMLDSGYSVFIEIGPHPLLLGSLQQLLEPGNFGVRMLPSMRREEPEREVLLRTLATLYIAGVTIDWKQLSPKGVKFIPLPVIPWQHQRYWIDLKSTNPKSNWNWSQATEKRSHPLLGDCIELASPPFAFMWQTNYGEDVMTLLADHRIEDEIVFPAAAYVEMALQVAVETGVNSSHDLCDFEFIDKMILQRGEAGMIQVLFSPIEEGNFMFSVYSRYEPGGKWLKLAIATFKQKALVDKIEPLPYTPPDIIRQESKSRIEADHFYNTLEQRGLQFGPRFRALRYIYNYQQESLGSIEYPVSLQHETRDYQIHPALLDACLQVVAATQGNVEEHNIYLPVGCRRISFFRQSAKIAWSQVSLHPDSGSDADMLEADIRLLDVNDQMLAEIIDFRLQRTSRRVRKHFSQPDTWLYQPEWQPQVEPCLTTDIAVKNRRWLIFADDEGLGEALAKQLEAAGDHCHLLSCHETINMIGNDPDGNVQKKIEDILQLITSPLYGVIHLWSQSIPVISTDIDENSDMMRLIGCNSVLFLVQALSKRFSGLPRLWLVTRGAQSVLPADRVAIEQSALWGLGKVISFEVPELKCIRMDLDPDQPVPELVSQLAKQLSIEDREDQIAYRAGKRYVQRLLPFEFSLPFGSSAVHFRADGTYLITGGLGGLGLATAAWMVHHGARHLVLMGRNEASPAVRRMVDQLRSEGAEVMVAQADVSKQAQLEGVMENISLNMPVLRGVIHAAGVLDDGSLLNLDAERMKYVMAPKIDGSWNLHKVTRHLSLDFFVLYSSAVSVLGSPGQGNYAAASAYLDAMAFYRRHLGLPALSINWGPWAEVGLAAQTAERLQEKSTSGEHLIKMIQIEDGLEILGRLLNKAAPQVMVLPFDLRNLIELYPTAAGMPFLADVGGNETHVARLYTRPNLRQKYVAPRNEIEQRLADIWRETLHIDRVGVHDSFFELGGDSVLAAQVLSLAQKTFGIRINAQDAFKAFTIERLAEMLEVEIFKKIEEMSEEEARQKLTNEN